MPEFHLSSPGANGVSCNADGASVGAIPLLNRLQKEDDKGAWHPRACEELSEQISALYNLPIDMSSKSGGLKAIANALNEGDMVRAQIATVLLGNPDVPPLSKDACPRGRMIKLIRDLHWSGLLKWDSDEHPRWPAGTPDDNGGKKGGKFAPKGEGNGTSASSAPPSETPGAARMTTRRDLDTSPPQTKPIDTKQEGFWQTLGSRLSHEAKSALRQIGQMQVAESENDFAAANEGANAVSQDLRAYAEYRRQLWLDNHGHPFQVPAIEADDPLSERAALMGHFVLEPKAPLTRPATNADWIDPLINLASFGAMGAGIPFRFAGPITEAIDAADIATTSTNVAERTFATTEGLAVRGSRAIDRAASYEAGVQKLYGDVPLSQRSFRTTVDGWEVSGVADSTTMLDDQPAAVDAKYVDLWTASLRNPESEIGAEPWAIAEQQNMMQQAKAYSSSFRGGVVYHTNSVELANYYTDLFEKAGIKNFRFKITPASKMGKRMTKDWKEELFGKPPYKRNIPGATPNTENNVRYISFDDPASLSELFFSVLDQVRPRLWSSGGAVLDGTKLKLPDGRQFVAVHYHDDVEGWRKQIEQGASKLGRATAKISAGNVIVSDGQSYPLSGCKVELS